VFSAGYIFRSIYAIAKYPSVLPDSLRMRKKIGECLYEKRKYHWSVIRSQYQTKTKNVFGLHMYLIPNDLSNVSSSIATLGWFNLPGTELVKKILKPGMTFIDIGANIGYYSVLASKLVGKGGLVVAFEPEMVNYSILKKTIQLNNLTNVIIKPQAVSDRLGDVELFLSDSTNPEAHSLTQDHQGGSVIVTSTTLDSFYSSTDAPKKIDVIKIHVGAEPQIIEGANRMLRQTKACLLITFARRLWTEKRNLLERLFKNYQIYALVESPYLLKKVSNADSLMQHNFAEFFLIQRT
jgi:FkbM family methyltransferase